MIKFWIQIITDNKLKKNFIYKSEKPYIRKDFFEHLVEICYQLHIPTPIVTKNHYQNFEEFHSMRFIERDFMEEIEFDRLIIEDISGQ